MDLASISFFDSAPRDRNDRGIRAPSTRPHTAGPCYFDQPSVAITARGYDHGHGHGYGHGYGHGATQ
jgi:hypothetical protein